MNVHRVRSFGNAEPVPDILAVAATDALLVAALDMDMSRLGIGTAMAYYAVPHRGLPPLPVRDGA